MAFLVEKRIDSAERKVWVVWELRQSVWVVSRLAPPLVKALTKEVSKTWGFRNKNIVDNLKLQLYR
jgi:hypothetical protein